MSIGLSYYYVLYRVQRDGIDNEIRYKRSTYGCPVDCPIRPTLYRETGFEVQARYKWMSIGLLYYVLYMVQRDSVDNDIRYIVRMGVQWTILYVLHCTERRDRQWDLKYRQCTYGCPWEF